MNRNQKEKLLSYETGMNSKDVVQNRNRIGDLIAAHLSIKICILSKLSPVYIFATKLNNVSLTINLLRAERNLQCCIPGGRGKFDVFWVLSLKCSLLLYLLKYFNENLCVFSSFDCHQCHVNKNYFES